jgi:hypothetical protein
MVDGRADATLRDARAEVRGAGLSVVNAHPRASQADCRASGRRDLVAIARRSPDGRWPEGRWSEGSRDTLLSVRGSDAVGIAIAHRGPRDVAGWSHGRAARLVRTPDQRQRPGSRPGAPLRNRSTIMSDIIETLLLRNLQEVFGESDPARRRAAIEELYSEDCAGLLPIGRYAGR